MQGNSNLFPIAIFAGRGQLPKILIDDCLKKNRDFVLFLLLGETYDIDYSQYNPTTIGYGEVEKFLKIIHDAKINNLVFIGAVTKPNFSSLKVDKKGAILLTKIIANKILGDDAVLRTVINFFEKESLKILRIDELLDCIISTKTTITKIIPSPKDFIDIASVNSETAGSAKMQMYRGEIYFGLIAVEAVEGTDAMIERCKYLNIDYAKNAILIKMKKTGQTRKADLPTIGISTIEKCHQSNIIGIAIQANTTLVLDKENLIKRADELGLFITTIK